MDLFKRHASLTVLVAVLFVQVVGLAFQVKRPSDAGTISLIRVWGINLIAPAEHGVVHMQDWVQHTWRNYFYLRDVRRENQRLQDEIVHLRLEESRLAEDADRAQRLQALLKFKQQYISETVAAQVIGSSGSEQSRILYIDKGSNDGLKGDMAVITPTGIVGKITRVTPNNSQVLEINDQSSGVGAILEKSRLQGILKGTPSGQTVVHYIMADEKVEVGERVLTSGGDRIFPKGLPIGRVVQVNPGADTFLNIRIKPSARLDRLEEVLVVTKVSEQQPELIPETPLRASEILAQRLPSVPVKPPVAAPVATASGGGAPPEEGVVTTVKKPASGGEAKPAPTGAITAKPATANGAAKPAVKPAAANGQSGATPGATHTGTVPQATGNGTAKANGTAVSKPKAPSTNGSVTQPNPAGSKPAAVPVKPKSDKPGDKPPAPTGEGQPQ